MNQTISDCCGAIIRDPIIIDYGMCPECGGHCEFIDEEQ